MLKGREILSLPVVTLEDRKQVGEVKDIIYDPYRKAVLGYLVENGGWLKDGKGFLHTEIIKRENDCLVIQNKGVIRGISSIPQLKEAFNKKNEIRGLRVENNEGRYIGVIQDLVIDRTTGDITGYEVSDGVIQDLLDGRVTIPNRGITISHDRVVACEEIGMDTIRKGESL